MKTPRIYKPDATREIDRALHHMKDALFCLNKAGASRSAQRVRLAISSAKGARRHAESLRFDGGPEALKGPRP